mgnify:CR=1 FL=1
MLPQAEEPLKAEALRLYRRYRDEIVLEFGLCPWAERALNLGQVTERVVLGGPETALQSATGLVPELVRSDAIDVALLIFPELELARANFDRFAQQLRNTLEGTDYGAVFALAAFHPVAEPNRGTSERFIPFLRRTPDPTLQLVRYSVLQRVREGTPQGTQFLDLQAFDPAVLASLKEEKSLRERIADRNLLEAERVGIETLKQIFADIQADRARSYQRLADAAAHAGS